MPNASQHLRHIVITLDYETWHPGIPAGKRIDWHETVIEPTARLLEICNRYNAKLTIFFEIGEYYWLRKNRPSVAVEIEEQLRGAIRDGHDVQLHLHTSWLPETGARYDADTDSWFWDDRYQKLHDYPGDITELLHRCKNDMETMLRPANPDYCVTTFRAGAYQIQPSKKIVDALLAVGIRADSSVWQGGYQPERGNDFRKAWSGQPYFSDKLDINMPSLATEAILEVPVSTIRIFRKYKAIPAIFLPKKTQRFFFDDVSFAFMKRIFDKLQSTNDRNFASIMIGHSKSNLRFHDIELLLKYVSDQDNIKFSTITEVVNIYSQHYSNQKAIHEFHTVEVIANECYQRLDPIKPHNFRSGDLILKHGFAWCAGYARAAKYLLGKKGITSRITTFFLEGFPFGRGKRKTDTHTILEVLIPSLNRWIVCDAMANLVYPYSLSELKDAPNLADQYLEEKKFIPDTRWIERRYEWYSTSKAYQRIVRIKHPNRIVEKIVLYHERKR